MKITMFKKIKDVLAYRGAWILLIFHTVGVVGLLSPWRELFISLTPYNLLLSALVLISGHRGDDLKLLVFFFVSALLSFFAEVVGVKTGLIFGEYAYGAGLGVHFLEVPLTIGLNWFMLTYSGAIIAWRFFNHKLIVAILTGFLLVFFDILMEPVAPKLDYWAFGTGMAPLQNYIGWFIVAFAILYSAGDMLKEASNRLAFPLIFIQTLFFITLNIAL
ncbi:MAG: carotenoid biosynthesis protein [Schleiferiaceae bacterium]|nr:carotenoid biosynthesis protein [Schleiferiaceae bacterium]